MNEYDNLNAAPTISFKGKGNCIRIGKSVVRLLGNPSHISIKVNDALDIVVVFPCDEDEIMSFKVPQNLFLSHEHSMRIHSKRFVHALMEMNEMDITRTYTVTGEYTEADNSMIFRLTDKVVWNPR